MAFEDGCQMLTLLAAGIGTRIKQDRAVVHQPAWNAPFLGDLGALMKRVRRGDVDMVIIALPAVSQARLDQITETIQAVSVDICLMPREALHLKTIATLIDEETILATRAIASSMLFADFRMLIVPEGEEAAANALRVNDVVLAGAGFPRTIDLLDRHGLAVVPLPTAEIGRIDASLSCMSLRWYG
jgi:N-dimethylarginine dimethylaminohydrolase